MDTMFDPRTRDRAIETTCSYLLMAGLLKTTELLSYMSSLAMRSDEELARALLTSRELYDRYLEQHWCLN